MLRTALEGEVGIDAESWKRGWDVGLVYEGRGEITLGVGWGSTRLAIEGDALARLTTWDGARGEPRGPVPYGSRVTMDSLMGS